MSCCSGGSCNFSFPDGPPLTDNAVTSLSATTLFLPYGTLLAKGEVVRIWTEGGSTEMVVVQEKIAIDVLPAGPEVAVDDAFKGDLPWQLIAQDSGFEYDELMDWYRHPLAGKDNSNDESKPVVLLFSLLNNKLTLSEKVHNWVYKLRSL